MAYATVEDVERMVGDIVIGRCFLDRTSYDDGGTVRYVPATTPSRTQVSTFIDNACARIDAHLKVHAYVLPIDTSDTVSLNWLKEANAAFTSARLLNTFAVRERDNLAGDEGELASRCSSFQSQVRDLMNAIEMGTFPAKKVSVTNVSTAIGVSASRDPIFSLADNIGV